MIRKHNDSVKPGCGIDDDLGADYTKKFNVADMQFAYPGNREVPSTEDIKGHRVRNNAGHAAYTSDDDAGLVRRDDFEHSAGSRQIWSDVEENARPGGEWDSTGPLTAGVSRGQK